MDLWLAIDFPFKVFPFDKYEEWTSRYFSISQLLTTCCVCCLRDYMYLHLKLLYTVMNGRQELKGAAKLIDTSMRSVERQHLITRPTHVFLSLSQLL